MTKILIVEDEKAIADLIKISLLTEGYRCTNAYDGKEAADMIEKETFDLILLDIMLPEIDGYELLEYIKAYEMPVIFISAKSGLNDRIKGLKAGAEDYITKPFEIQELLARVEVVLRRYGMDGKKIELGSLTIDPCSRIVTKEGESVGLTAKEFDLLFYLSQNMNRVLSRTQIYAAVWGGEYTGDSRTVDLHIQRVRKKLGLEKEIVPVYKIGYRMEVKK